MHPMLFNITGFNNTPTQIHDGITKQAASPPTSYEDLWIALVCIVILIAITICLNPLIDVYSRWRERQRQRRQQRQQQWRQQRLADRNRDDRDAPVEGVGYNVARQEISHTFSSEDE